MFNTQEECLAYLYALHNSSTICRVCHRKGMFHKHPTKPCYTCNCGRTHIYPQSKTIFQHSHLPLPLWFQALEIYYTNKGDCTIHTFEKALGVSYKTGWRMLGIIRTVTEGLPIKRISKKDFLKHCLKETQVVHKKNASPHVRQ